MEEMEEKKVSLGIYYGLQVGLGESIFMEFEYFKLDVWVFAIILEIIFLGFGKEISLNANLREFWSDNFYFKTWVRINLGKRTSAG